MQQEGAVDHLTCGIRLGGVVVSKDPHPDPDPDPDLGSDFDLLHNAHHLRKWEFLGRHFRRRDREPFSSLISDCLARGLS